MKKGYRHNLLVWFLISCATTGVLLGGGSCAPRSYFLVNSDLQMKYNRASGEWFMIWKSAAKHVQSNPDSIPSEPVKVHGSVPVEFSPDSIIVSD